MKWIAFFGLMLLALAGARQVSASQELAGGAARSAEGERIAAPVPEATPNKAGNADDDKAVIPYTPYPAGLSWVLTPQPFRVPIPDRIFYYPPHTYVRRCPYYPRGYYWGANWRFNVVGRGNLLFFGPFRFNPYLTAAKAQHHPQLRGQRRYAPPAGPQGQAMLLGGAAMPPESLSPSVAKRAKKAASGAAEAPAPTVRRASQRRPAHAASSRRTRKRSIANSR